MTSTNITDQTTFEEFRDQIRGEVRHPGDDSYTLSRTVWNAATDRYPSAIVRCAGPADVITAVDFARECGLDLGVKGGGHHVAGHAIPDDGLVIDLGSMNAVRVAPDAQTVQVEGGATWGELNHETHAFGLETVGMPDADVGVGGFTLGGGIGLLSRRRGLAIDTLQAVDIVTGEGELVRASETRNPDLFWAVRGGGGAVGVVTSFEFSCVELDPTPFQALFWYPIGDAADVLRTYREFTADAPEEVATEAGIGWIPADPDVPATLHGEPAAFLKGTVLGERNRGRHALELLRGTGNPVVESVGQIPFDELGTPLADDHRTYWTSHYLRDLTDEAIAAIVDRAVPRPTPLTRIAITSLGGAINEVPADATAYPHRDATHLLEIVIQWTDPANDEANTSWVRDVHETLAPYATGREYLNSQTDAGPERAQAALGDNYDRVVALTQERDPRNLLTLFDTVDHDG